MGQIEQTIEELYANNGSKLHQMCHKEMAKFGGISQMDYDDFYSRVGYEITIAKEKFDPSKGKTFFDYISGVVKFSVWKEMEYRNRKKRQIITEVEVEDENGNIVKKKKYVQDISLDAPVGDKDGLTIGNILQSNFNIDDILKEDIKGCQDERIENYLGGLSKKTRQIIEMKMNDIAVSEIKKKLNLTEKEYRSCMDNARINENIALFTKQSNRQREEFNVCNIIPIDVTDNYRMDKIPLGSLLDDMKDGKINKKHILQRRAFQWTDRQANKYLTRVLNGQPIPEIVICEQTVKGKKKSHLIDGLQRLSYSELFRADGIVVKSDGAEFYEIPYKEYQCDDNGNTLLDEDGDAIFEEKIFNVIGKKFSELPQFIKERFNKFNINVTTYFNCTDEQIAYHIRNYNNQEGMNKNQYEFTEIDINIANKIKDISENHLFFKDDYGRYTGRNKRKGDIDKVVVESIMSINFLDNWKKEVKDSFAYVNKNATDEMFDSLRDTLDRLCHIVDKEVKNIFTITNSSVWFAVFDKFKQLNVPDSRFKSFIKHIDESLENLELDGKPFIEIYKSKNTRDKKIVLGKIDGLISFMLDYFNINRNEMNKQIDEITFIAEIVGIDTEILKQDIEAYKETLIDLERNTIKDGSKLLDKKNQLSLLAMVAYSYKEDFDLDSWMVEYAKENKTYFFDQKKNFLHMKQDFENYIAKKNRDSP